MTRQGWSDLSLVGRVDENGNPMVNPDGSAKHYLIVDGVYATAGTHTDPVTGATVSHNAGDKNESVVTDLRSGIHLYFRQIILR